MKMPDDEIRAIVAETLAEQQRLQQDSIDAIVLKAVASVLASFGIEDDDRKEVRADFQHLRRFRKSHEQVERVGWTAAITMMVTAFGTALWLGIKASLGK